MKTFKTFGVCAVGLGLSFFVLFPAHGGILLDPATDEYFFAGTFEFNAYSLHEPDASYSSFSVVWEYPPEYDPAGQPYDVGWWTCWIEYSFLEGGGVLFGHRAPHSWGQGDATLWPGLPPAFEYYADTSTIIRLSLEIPHEYGLATDHLEVWMEVTMDWEFYEDPGHMISYEEVWSYAKGGWTATHQPNPLIPESSLTVCVAGLGLVIWSGLRIRRRFIASRP
ncbi:MAG: hypothetical protein H7A45_08675 [Verrucomicrobiales bacterium]|nr:hypothetical protein [Verrucomicrobiales bacterium]